MNTERLASLRESVKECEQAHGDSFCDMFGHHTVRELLAELERLTGERDAYLDRVDEVVVRAQENEVRALQAEGERDRLAEALRKVERLGTTEQVSLHPIPPWGDGGHTVRPELNRQAVIAREALAGLPDNTNEGK